MCYFRWKKKDTLPDENIEQEGSTAPGLHTYDQVDCQNRPNDVSAAPMPYEIAVSDIYNDVAPPIPPPPPMPEEMGFTVTKDIDHDQDGYEEFEPDPTRAAKNALVTPNPFYTTTDNNTNPHYENHELVEYEDYEDLSGKRDLSVEDPSRQNFQLQSAINFCDRQDIEGELIDEVDYQNVTVVRTKVLNSRQDYPSHQDLLQQGMATTAIQWQEKSTDSADFNRSYNKKDQQPLPNTNSADEDFAEEVYDDVSQMTQDKLYQNFGAEHSSVARVQSSTSLKEDEDIYEDTQMDSDVAATEIYDGMDDLYINTGSIQNQKGSNEADIDYENMVLGKFRT